MYGNRAQSYFETNIMTADPKKLVLICYEGAIDYLNRGKKKYREGDYEGKAEALSKAREVITELLSCLDFEKGGVIAKNLAALYNYMLKRLLSADVNKDTEAVDEVLGMLAEMKAAWEQISAEQ
ncbi:MAG: flagellar export chaperone FliS [Deltaproteobacteria bacterium]|nr:flagellar export chaperone FliS [Deltaproteobacteria bacterium]MBW1919731.1 flagellar export chaperone FliS [Deltaproteobacteria bacterium]MBW2045329.1 flagellar export chaperone FliS [Deltaproteobacteria bacterium]